MKYALSITYNELEEENAAMGSKGEEEWIKNNLRRFIKTVKPKRDSGYSTLEDEVIIYAKENDRRTWVRTKKQKVSNMTAARYEKRLNL